MKIYVLGKKLSEKEVQQFLKDYYPYSYLIAEKYRSPYLTDDVKENIAWTALERALKTYDSEKGASFKSWLYIAVTNDLHSEVAKMKKRPISVRDIEEPETGERKDIFEFIADSKVLQQSDPTFYNELLDALEKALTPRQRQLLDILMTPQKYVDEFNQKYKTEATKLNYDMIGKMLNISIASITYEVHKIQKITNEILQKLNGNAR